MSVLDPIRTATLVYISMCAATASVQAAESAATGAQETVLPKVSVRADADEADVAAERYPGE